MAKKDKTKYYLQNCSGGQVIRLEPNKHPIIWRFLAKEWDRLCDEYRERAKGKKYFMGHYNLPLMKFDDENWKLIEKEVGFKGHEFKLCIDGTQQGFCIFKHDIITKIIDKLGENNTTIC